jgi:hypothetical protein
VNFFADLQVNIKYGIVAGENAGYSWSRIHLSMLFKIPVLDRTQNLFMQIIMFTLDLVNHFQDTIFGRVADPAIRIRSGSGFGIRTEKGKMTHKKSTVEKNLKIYVLKCWRFSFES